MRRQSGSNPSTSDIHPVARSNVPSRRAERGRLRSGEFKSRMRYSEVPVTGHNPGTRGHTLINDMLDTTSIDEGIDERADPA